MEEKDIARSCIDCHVVNCRRGEEGQYPDFCLTTNVPNEIQNRAMDLLREPENNRIAVSAAEVEYEGYGKRTRVEEVIQFARKIGAHKLGIATCAGLLDESRTLAKILRTNGFEVYGAVCKMGANPKVSIGIPKECEAVGVNMCNPIMQAKTLAAHGCDFNIVIGLCVGHDTLFLRHSKVPTTVMIVKDRVLQHNPVAALYGAQSMYSRFKDLGL